MILPERVLGRSSVKTIEWGLAIFPIILATWSRSSSATDSSPTWAPLIVTKATMASPTRASGRDTTAASATVGWSTSADSTSVVETRWPDTFITSSTRPSNQR